MIGIAIILVNYKGYKDTLECIKALKKAHLQITKL